MLKISNNADPNYLAVVITCPELKNHPNADRLQLANVFGGDVIVAKDLYTPGEKLVYFPVESCISQKFLSWANLLDKPEFNADGKTKGFFSMKNGRVKAVKLREIPSQGFLFKVSKLAEYYGVDESVFGLNDSFDTVGDDLLVTKYVKNQKGVHVPTSSKKRIPVWVENIISFFPLFIRKRIYKVINFFYDKKNEGIGSLIVDGQWKFHYKTENLGRNIFTISPEDDIVISSKAHGTSFIGGNILCKKPFNFYRWIKQKLGFKVENTEYKFVYSSRSVLKNRRDGKYTEDVWGLIAEELEPLVPENIIIYGEIVGWSSAGKHVQKNYDYGFPIGQCGLWVYRMVENTENGPREMSWGEIEKFCKREFLNTVPVYYKGKAKDLFGIENENWKYFENDGNKWSEDFLSKLKEKYLDKTCEFCLSGVVNEGIVIRNESKDSKPALKYKSPTFLVKESAARDKGEEDIEEES